MRYHVNPPEVRAQHSDDVGFPPSGRLNDQEVTTRTFRHDDHLEHLALHRAEARDAPHEERQRVERVVQARWSGGGDGDRDRSDRSDRSDGGSGGSGGDSGPCDGDGGAGGSGDGRCRVTWRCGGQDARRVHVGALLGVALAKEVVAEQHSDTLLGVRLVRSGVPVGERKVIRAERVREDGPGGEDDTVRPHVVSQGDRHVGSERRGSGGDRGIRHGGQKKEK